MKQPPNPIGALTRDHEEVLKKMGLLSEGARGLGEDGSGQALETVGQVLQFLDTDIRHHVSLEEEALFPVLERHMGREGGPIAVMLGEHEDLWANVSQLQQAVEALKRDGGGELARKASQVAQYIARLLEAHVHKENMILFPMAQQALNPAEIAEVARKWESVCSRRG